VALAPRRRTFEEARTAVNRRRQSIEASFEVRGGTMFAFDGRPSCAAAKGLQVAAP
jgi:hypothetical protein